MNGSGEFDQKVRQNAGPGTSIAAAKGKRRLLRLWMVDDDVSLRQTFAQLLNSKPGLRVTRQFASIEPMLAALAEERPPDIVLLDLNLGKENGLSAIRPVKKLAPRAGVLMLTTFNNTYSEEEAFRLGASGFLLKIYELDELVALIHQSFYHPGDPRLFPNLSERRRLHGSLNPKTIADSSTHDRHGFFGALRRLCRPHRRQPAK